MDACWCLWGVGGGWPIVGVALPDAGGRVSNFPGANLTVACLLHTSDAADDLTRGVSGGLPVFLEQHDTHCHATQPDDQNDSLHTLEHTVSSFYFP